MKDISENCKNLKHVNFHRCTVSDNNFYLFSKYYCCLNLNKFLVVTIEHAIKYCYINKYFSVEKLLLYCYKLVFAK